MLLKKELLLVLCVLLTNCAQLSGQISSGIYTDPYKEFSIKTPPIPGLSAQDGQITNRRFVDFYQARGFWRKYGLYSVEWYSQKKDFKTEAAYYTSVKRFIPAYVKNNYSNRGGFKLVDARKITVNTYPAYQFISTGTLDELDAIWVGTSINFGTRIAIVSMLFHSESVSGSTQSNLGFDQRIPWKKYNLFVNSLRKY